MSNDVDVQTQLENLKHEIKRLMKVNSVLMNRVERSVDSTGNAFSLFESNILLQETVSERTRELAEANESLRCEIREHAQAEQTLRESEEKYRVLFESAADILAVLDSEARFVDLSKSFLDEFGDDTGKFIGVKANECNLISDSSLDTLLSHFDLLSRGEAPPMIEVECRNRAGDLMPYELSAVPVMRDGKLVAVQTSLRNIAERKDKERQRQLRLEATLRQQTALMRLTSDPRVTGGCLEDALSTILEESARALQVARASIWFLDDDGQTLTCADLWDKSEGVHSSGIVLQSSDYPGYMTAIRSELVVDAHDALTDPRTREFATGYLDVLNVTSLLDASVRVGGKVTGVVCFEQVGLSRVWSGDEITFASAVSDQIAQAVIGSERLEAVKALKESESRYRKLFNASNDAIIIMQNGVCVDCNLHSLAIFHCTSDQIIGHSPHEFAPTRQPDGQFSEDAAKVKLSAVLNGEPQFYEWRLRRFDGVEFDAEISLTSIGIGNETFLQAIVRDITERKQAEEQQAQLKDQLERADRMKSLGVLAGGVAHDLNNMLGPLVGYPDLILHQLPADSPLRRQIKLIGDSAQSAADVIQDLLTLARRGRYEMQPLNVNELVSRYLESPGFEKLVALHPEIKVAVNLDSHLSSITGSSPHLSKAVMNLIVNAFDAMPDGGSLTIATGSVYLERLPSGYEDINAGDYISITVKDTGQGIDPDCIDKIFEPYYSKKKMGTSGSGLGLSVVYGVVKDHRGYYDIVSEVGRGAEFVLYLPACNESCVAESQPEVNDLKGHERILVVDDVAEQREVATALIKTLGYEAASASSGREAVKYVEHNQVDLVMMDMILGDDMDGLDTYEALLNVRPGLKAIIVSGFSATDRVARMQELGAGGYVKKPFTLRTVAEAIHAELIPQRQV